LSRPYSPRSSPSAASFTRVNGKIRAREVRVIDADKKMLGVMPLGEAINLARARAVDLVEIAPNATPPVCRLIAFGKYRYEMAKQEKEARKHQHANRVKEIQLSPNIDPHDFGVKLQHGVDFLCEDMKVKITLRFRGREMAHKELGFQQVEKFVNSLTPYGHPDAPPKLIGKGINVMLSPLPRVKRAKNPRQAERDLELAAQRAAGLQDEEAPDDDSPSPEPEDSSPSPEPENDSPSPDNPPEFGGNGAAAGQAEAG
jgi:translation initiation factor IF-3